MGLSDTDELMRHWYGMHSKPQKEFFLEGQLSFRRVEVYCPTIRIPKPGQRKWKFRPYFPGYLFTHIDLDEVHASILRWLPGAVGLVDFGGKPAYVPESLVARSATAWKRSTRTAKSQR